jgi:hypothetical protein
MHAECPMPRALEKIAKAIDCNISHKGKLCDIHKRLRPREKIFPVCADFYRRAVFGAIHVSV